VQISKPVSAATIVAGGGIAGTVGTTDNAIARANGTGGGTVQGSLVTIDDLGGLQPDLTTGFVRARNTGLRIFNNANTFTLNLTVGTAITANRALTLTTGDASRTVTIEGDPILVGGRPVFAHTWGGNLTGISTTGIASCGSIVTTTVGVIPAYACSMKRIQSTFHVASIGAGNPDVTCTVYKNTNTGAGARIFTFTVSAVAVTTGYTGGSTSVLNSLGDFNGTTDFYTIIWTSSASTVTASPYSMLVEFERI
jgi:hypothetical protein